MALESNRVINGSFGSVYEDGQWLTNFNSAEAIGEINYEDVRRSGTRKIGHKATDIRYSGSIRGYKITSELTKKVGQVNDDTKAPFVTELIFKLADPEAYGYERVRLKGVQFTRLDIMRFEHGSIVEQEWPFVFDDYEFLDEITAS